MLKHKKKRRKFNFRISQKYAVAFITLSLVTIAVLSGAYYSYSRQLIDRQTEQYISKVLEQVGTNLKLRLTDFDTLIFNIQSDPAVQEQLNILKDNKMSDYDRYIVEKNMRDAVYKHILYTDAVESVLIVTDAGITIPVSKNLRTYELKESYKNEIYKAGGSPVWLTPNIQGEYISIAGQINSLKTIKPLGYVVVNLLEDQIYSMYSNMEFSQNGTVNVVNDELRIISSKNKELLNTRLPGEYEKVLESKSKSGFFTRKIQGIQQYVVFRKLTDTEWYLVATVPVITYSQALYSLRQYIWVVVIIAVMLAAAVTVLVTYSLSRPIIRLSRAMQAFGEGDFNAMCDVKTQDEIGVLSYNFNRMVYNINDLIEKVYDEKLLQQQAELKSLRMQINPHFLYNTLETINWIARIKGVPEIGVIAKSLGDMMRLTINGSDFITIFEDMKNINNYYTIQKWRYGDRIELLMDIEEALYGKRIPKLILQPLIENSIVHGIEEKDGQGLIEVTGRLEPGEIVLTVKDNGIGMPQTVIDEILVCDYFPDSEEYKSVGMRNVNQRLKLYYGEYYGLNIRSTPNKGTEITIRIPAEIEKQN